MTMMSHRTGRIEELVWYCIGNCLYTTGVSPLLTNQWLKANDNLVLFSVLLKSLLSSCDFAPFRLH